MKKRCFIIGLIVALLLGIMPAFASSYESNRYITFEEYAAEVEAEYAKYGIEGGVYKPKGEFICTYDTLQSDLAIVREFCRDHVKSQAVPIMIESKLEPDINPTAMPGHKIMTDLYTHIDMTLPIVPLYCKIKTTVRIDIDYQRPYIISVGTPTLEVTEATGFADWIEYVSHSTIIDQDKGSVTMYINCKVKQEMSLGGITSWAKIDINYSAKFKDVTC